MNRDFELMPCMAGRGGSRGTRRSLEWQATGNRSPAASAVNAKGAFLFVTYKGGMTAELFVCRAKAYNAWAAEATIHSVG